MLSLQTSTTVALTGYVCVFVGAVVYLATFPMSSKLIVYAQVNLLLWAINAAIFLYGLECSITGGCVNYAWIIGTVVFLVGVMYLLKSIFKFVENDRRNASPSGGDFTITSPGWPSGGVTLPRL